MSLVSSRLSLVHRATTERNQNLNSDDGWGNPLPPDWETNLIDLECRAWIASHQVVTSKGSLVVVLEVHLIVPLGTDILNEDRITTISWRGDTFIDGILDVQAVLRQKDHLEVILAKAA